MALLEIPTRGDLNAYTFRVDLERRTYEMEMSWNERDSVWALTVRTNQGVDLITGVPMRLNLDLLTRFRNPELPPGILIVADTLGKFEEPNQSEMGTRWQLLYLEAGA